MKTAKLYENNTYLRSCEGVVTDVHKEHPSDGNCEQMYTVCFDQTVFFPEGGGQSADTGTALLEHDDAAVSEHSGSTDSVLFDVIDAQKKDGVVYHMLRRAAGTDCGQDGNSQDSNSQDDYSPDSNRSDDDSCSQDDCEIRVGDKMKLTIDWAHRFDNMQRHLGEHILSGAFYRLYGAVNKGFHMGDDYITIDLAFDHDAQERMGLYHYDRVTWEMAEKAELEANRVIWLDAPVTRSHFDTREEAEKLPLRKALAFDEDISIVTVGDLDKPYDCVACCGTHPSSAGQVGLIKIYKIEPNKGMSRITLECGERAFRHYQTRLDDMYDISCDLSAGYDDISKKYAIAQEKTGSLHDRIFKLSRHIVQSEAESILTSGRDNEIRRYDDLDVNDLLLIVKQMDHLMSKSGSKYSDGKCSGENCGLSSNKCGTGSDKCGTGSDTSSAFKRPTLTILVSSTENTAILVSDQLDCGRLIKEKAPAFSGKGGGKPQMARAMFGTAGDLDDFITTILD